MPSTHITTVQLTDGREVLLSYGVPVAAKLATGEYVKTSQYYSVTTSRHVNQYLGDQKLTVRALAHADFLALIAPITDGRP